MDKPTTKLGYAPLFLLALAVWISYKIMKRFRDLVSERRAEVLIRRFDSEVRLSLDEIVSEERRRADVGTVDGKRVRFRPQKLNDMGIALAHEAYYHFGHRPRSDANILITRKYMRDLLEEYEDLRAVDAARAIDMGLYLSFLPSSTLREMNVISDTIVFDDRDADVPSFLRLPWWLPFRRFLGGSWRWPFRGRRSRA
jgi:hypothetical protein